MIVERQHRIFIEPWPDSIHIALWRNDRFLHSLIDFYIHSIISPKVMHLAKIL